jgi:hypothetical protein
MMFIKIYYFIIFIKITISFFRYICLEPEFKEDFAEYLLNHDDPDGAAFLFYEIFKDEGFASKNRKSKF